MVVAHTRNWWLMFSVAGILLSLGSCSSESIPAQLSIDDEPGAIAGELAVYVAKFDDGTAETRYFLKQRDGAERRLHFSVEPDITPGAHLKVWGIGRADSIEVVETAASPVAAMLVTVAAVVPPARPRRRPRPRTMDAVASSPTPAHPNGCR